MSNRMLLRSFMMRFVPTVLGLVGLIAYATHDHRPSPGEIYAAGAVLGCLAALMSWALARDTARLDHALAREREERQFATSIFEHSGEGMFVTDAENRIVRVNRAFTDITGYSAEEAIGRNPSFLASGRQDAAYYAAIWQALACDGHWQGEIVNRRKNGQLLAEWLSITVVRDAAGHTLRHIAIFSDITERRASEERTRFLAQHDVLTGLVNRQLLEDRLAGALFQAARSGRRVAVLMVDLDRFKPVNDRFGHAAGDELLRQAAGRLAQAVRQTDTVARVGGDEFVIVLTGIHGAEDAVLVADRLLARLEAPYAVADTTIEVGASIGIALDGEGGVHPAELVGAADKAMYEAKRNGGSTYLRAGIHAAVSAARVERALAEAGAV